MLFTEPSLLDREFDTTENLTKQYNLNFLWHNLCNMDELQKRLPSQIFTKLIDANYDSLKVMVLSEERILQQNAGLTLRELENVLEVVAEVLLRDKIKRAAEVPDWEKISTGCKNIDLLMHGGVPVNGITEIYGNSGVGKTQFCLQLSLMVQLPKSQGGLGKGVVYMCTEDIFPSKRLNQLTQTFQTRFDPTINYEDNIFLEHIADFEQIRRCLWVRLPNLLAKTKIGLIIIDSIAGIFRNNNEKINYLTRKEEYVAISSKLYELSDKFSVAILCTNQVTDNLQTGDTEPALGLAWSNVVTTRLRILRNFNSPVRHFDVIFSPNLPCSTCTFTVKNIGIVDA